MFYFGLRNFRIMLLFQFIAFCITALTLLPQPALADFYNVVILRFDTEAQLENFGRSRRRDNQNGLTVSKSGRKISVDGLTGIDKTVNNNHYRKLKDYDAGYFQLGQFVVVCFTPSKSMKLRMIDTNPKGRKDKLFPHNASYANVSGGKEYCLGDPESTLTLKMGTISGTGKGRLYLVGTPIKNKLPTYDNRPIPKIDATVNGTASNGRLFEAWVIYKVE